MFTTRSTKLGAGVVAALAMAASPAAAQGFGLDGMTFTVGGTAEATPAKPAAADTVTIAVRSITTVDANGKKTVQVVAAQAAQIKAGQVVLFREEKNEKAAAPK